MFPIRFHPDSETSTYILRLLNVIIKKTKVAQRILQEYQHIGKMGPGLMGILTRTDAQIAVHDDGWGQQQLQREKNKTLVILTKILHQFRENLGK